MLNQEIEIRKDPLKQYHLVNKRTGQRVLTFDSRYYDTKALRDLADRIDADQPEAAKRVAPAAPKEK